MPAFETRQQNNGVYMTELLPRIKQNTRIEYILMEVNEAVNTNPIVVQRPMFESDSTADCRLTTQISVEGVVSHWHQKYELWFQATSKCFAQELKF